MRWAGSSRYWPGWSLTGAVVTADALHTHADAAGFLVTGKQAHYLFTVKANQPTLLGRCQRLATLGSSEADAGGARGGVGRGC